MTENENATTPEPASTKATKAEPADSEPKKQEEEQKAPEWPKHLDGIESCPPSTAPPTVGAFFRWFDTRRAKSAYESGRSRPGFTDCQRAGISAFRSEAALRAAAPHHQGKARRPVLKADLSADHGKAEPSGSTAGHHSLWLRRQYIAMFDALFLSVDTKAGP